MKHLMDPTDHLSWSTDLTQSRTKHKLVKTTSHPFVNRQYVGQISSGRVEKLLIQELLFLHKNSAR